MFVVLNFKAFSFLHHLPWSCVFILMLIVLMTLQSKKQDIVSRSSNEVEYPIMALTIVEVVWLHWHLSDICVLFLDQP